MSVKEFFAIVQRYFENSRDGEFKPNPVTLVNEWHGNMGKDKDGNEVQLISKSTIRCSLLREDMQANMLTNADIPIVLTAKEVTTYTAGFPDCAIEEGVEYKLRPTSINPSLDGLWIVVSYASAVSERTKNMSKYAKKGL